MKTLNNIASAFDFPTELLAIEYVFSGGEELYVCHLKTKKGNVSLEEVSQVREAEDLVSEGPLKLPVILMFSGKKVLTKKLEYSGEAGNDELAARAFPGVQRENLLFQVDQLEEENYSVSAIRRDIVREVLEAFEKANIQILDMAIGPYGLWPLLANSAGANSMCGKYQVDTENLEISADPHVSGEVKIFGQSLPARFSGAFLFGLQTLASRSFRNDFAPLANGREEWKYGLFFKKGVMMASIFFFTLLLVNFLLFTHYQSKNNELTRLTGGYDLQFREVSALKSSFEEKSEFLRINGGQNSRMAQMGDQLAGFLPKELSLSEMNFQPVTQKLKKENLVRFSRNKLQIEGTTGNYESFQKWLYALRGLAWVGDIEILGYQETDSKHRADFSIQIKLRDE